MIGLRFRRQQTIGPYIVDFFRPSAKLIVELDGGQHAEDGNAAYDEARSKWLAECGYRVLRFWNTEFLRNPEIALEGIWLAIKDSGVPLPEPPDGGSTLPQGEG